MANKIETLSKIHEVGIVAVVRATSIEQAEKITDACIKGGVAAIEILDRVGGGDSFASGLIYGLMTYQDAQKAVNYGAVHGALAMTTPGDTSMASLKEVEAKVNGGTARVQR